MLEAARAGGVKRVVYASTIWVYSDVDGDRSTRTRCCRAPAHLYTARQARGRAVLPLLRELYGARADVLRFGIPYGPRARPAAVIPRFVERALRGEPLMIAGTGEQARAFVYVEDLADGVVRALAPQAAGRTYNLVGRETTTIRRARRDRARRGRPDADRPHRGRAGDFHGATVSGARAERELGWRATTPLREGVRRYAAWSAGEDAAVAPAPHARPAPAPGAAAPGRAARARWPATRCSSVRPG